MHATTMGNYFPREWNDALAEIQRVPESNREEIFTPTSRSFYHAGNALTTASSIGKNLCIADLGWTPVEALETHMRLRSFSADWDAPGMEMYDDL